MAKKNEVLEKLNNISIENSRILDAIHNQSRYRGVTLKLEGGDLGSALTRSIQLGSSLTKTAYGYVLHINADNKCLASIEVQDINGIKTLADGIIWNIKELMFKEKF